MLSSARVNACILGLGLLLRGTDAAADEPPAAPSRHPWQIYAPIGVNMGAAFNPKRLDNGFILGGEASVAATNKDYLWFGGYVDALHDFGADSTRISIGPELGLFIVGVDGGLVLSTLDGLHAGIVGRILLTLPVVSGYARLGTIFDSPQEGVYGEVGVLIKIPVPIPTGEDSSLERTGGPAPSPPPEPPPMPKATPDPPP